MTEFLQLCGQPFNLPWTLLLGLVVLYWVGVIVGALDLDAFDFDLDADVDVDADADVEVDTDASVHGGSALLGVLRFFEFGTVPTMVIVSFFALGGWTAALLFNFHFGGSTLVGFLLLIPIFLVALAVTKVTAVPLAALFRQLENEDTGTVTVEGQICTVKSSKVDGESGQAEVKSKGAPVLLNVRTRNGEVLHRGDEAVVVEPDPETGTYFVARL